MKQSSALANRNPIMNYEFRIKKHRSAQPNRNPIMNYETKFSVS